MKYLVATMILGASLMWTPAAGAAENDARQIAMMAEKAKTPAEHTEVAKLYLSRAKALEKKAEKLESELKAERSSSWQTPMATKWPAMVENNRERRERIAIQARRNAAEAYDKAEFHSREAGKSLEQIASLRDEE